MIADKMNNLVKNSSVIRAMFEELGDTGSKVGEIIQNKTGKSFTTLMDEGSSLADVMGILVEASGGSKDNFNALWSSSEARVPAVSCTSTAYAVPVCRQA